MLKCWMADWHVGVWRDEKRMSEFVGRGEENAWSQKGVATVTQLNSCGVGLIWQAVSGTHGIAIGQSSLSCSHRVTRLDWERRQRIAKHSETPIQILTLFVIPQSCKLESCLLSL